MRDYVREPIRESITIDAPIERCWALSIRVELVQRTLGMEPVGSITAGSVAAHSRVQWRGWKFGLPTEHHTLITRFEPPHEEAGNASKKALFQDTQEQGRFAFFQHDHHFREVRDGPHMVTILEDEVRFALPFGVVGKVVARLIMEPHIVGLARQRFGMIKELAEGDGWRDWM